MHIIDFVINVPAVTTILAHLGEPTATPEVDLHRQNRDQYQGARACDRLAIEL
jgi:hypothetical protein